MLGVNDYLSGGACCSQGLGPALRLVYQRKPSCKSRWRRT